MNGLPKYEKYKDSGIDWVGEMPHHWELKPFSSLFYFRNEKNDPLKTENILSLSIANGVTEYSEEGRGGKAERASRKARGRFIGKGRENGGIVLTLKNIYSTYLKDVALI